MQGVKANAKVIFPQELVAVVFGDFKTLWWKKTL